MKSWFTDFGFYCDLIIAIKQQEQQQQQHDDVNDDTALLNLDVEAIEEEAHRLGRVHNVKVSNVSCIDTAIPF